MILPGKGFDLIIPEYEDGYCVKDKIRCLRYQD